MDTKNKVKLSIAVVTLACAIGLIAWYVMRSSSSSNALDPERAGPQVDAPTDPTTGKPTEHFSGSSRTPGKR